MSQIRFATKQYPKLDDDALYDLICNIHYQLQHRQPHGPVWLGYGMQQWHQDLISYQRIIWDVKPNLIIELGTGGGGCTLFFASILELMDTRKRIIDYKILTIDLPSNNPNPDLRNHPHIVYIQGDSESVEVIEKVKSFWRSDKVTMVFIDTAHNPEHVFKEMEAYSPLVSVGSYMVVEDTWLGYSIFCGDRGPMAAVEKWIKKHDNWVVDTFFNRWLLTQHPCGWLKRVK